MGTDLESPANLKQAYDRLWQRIDDAATRRGRSAEQVLMVAVTKYASLDQVRALIELGHADLGESRAQQLTQRAGQIEEFLSRKRMLGPEGEDEDEPGSAAVPERVRWHMVGHLQRNKIKQVVPAVDLIHSLDTLRLAEELHSYGSKQDRTIDILIQVNQAGDPNKYGIAPAAVIHLAEQIHTMLNLRLRGLMAMAPYCDDPEDARPIFRQMGELFEDLRRQSFVGSECNILSMGMSHDFEVAVEEGANVLRIGSALFGEQEG